MSSKTAGDDATVIKGKITYCTLIGLRQAPTSLGEGIRGRGERGEREGGGIGEGERGGEGGERRERGEGRGEEGEENRALFSMPLISSLQPFRFLHVLSPPPLSCVV